MPTIVTGAFAGAFVSAISAANKSARDWNGELEPAPLPTVATADSIPASSDCKFCNFEPKPASSDVLGLFATAVAGVVATLPPPPPPPLLMLEVAAGPGAGDIDGSREIESTRALTGVLRCVAWV